MPEFPLGLYKGLLAVTAAPPRPPPLATAIAPPAPTPTATTTATTIIAMTAAPDKAPARTTSRVASDPVKGGGGTHTDTYAQVWLHVAIEQLRAVKFEHVSRTVIHPPKFLLHVAFKQGFPVAGQTTGV